MIFPFPSARGPQEEMMRDVRDALEQRGHLVADAPTGLGKTAAALFPSVEYAVENFKTVFFLTSRLSQHKMAVETLRMMRKENDFSAVDIVGKKHLCSHDVVGLDGSTFNSFCSTLVKEGRCAFYENSKTSHLEKAKLFGAFKKGPLSTQEAMRLFSSRYCTHEMLMDAARNADVIVGDYFHMFGMGQKMLKRTNKGIDTSIIIVDEAHNLAPRIRNDLSFRITQRTCDLAAKEAGDEENVREYAEGIAKAMQRLAKKHLTSGHESFVARGDFIDEVSHLGNYDSISSELRELSKIVLQEKKKSFLEKLAAFLSFWKGDDFGYSRILSREVYNGKSFVSLNYNCLDPSIVSREIIAGSHSTILMSGTLAPMEMHRDLLGMAEARTAMKSYMSPFPKNNRKNIIVSGMTTLYKSRNDENFSLIGAAVSGSVNSIKGNAAVFFPSYDMRNKIGGKIHTGKHLIFEESGMTKEERDMVKENLEEHKAKGAVLLGVMGGSFSEGIDLPGDLLNGVVVVGIPLERPTLSVQSLIDYYDERFHRGRDYGYNFPAMIKVMQSAGRCIRSENDRGVVVFIDDRFLWKNYRDIFPKSWQFTVTKTPSVEIRKFFGN